MFVGDAYSSVQVAFPQRDSWAGLLGYSTPVTAGALASGTVAGTASVSQENARLGDVVAWKAPFSDATGHAGIFTGPIGINGVGRPNPGDFGFIGTGRYTINVRTGTYISGETWGNTGHSVSESMINQRIYSEPSFIQIGR